MYNPQTDKVVNMVTTLSNKHIGEINWLQLRWEIVDIYDARYPDGLIQQLVPMLDIDFK